MRCPRGNSRVISEYREFGCATLYFLYSFSEYVNNGLKRIHVKFYIEGSEPGKQGTVHAEVGENPGSGQFEFRYIFVEVTPTRSIIVEDNRSQQS